jgi:hypothetical protein
MLARQVAKELTFADGDIDRLSDAELRTAVGSPRAERLRVE